MLIVSVPHAPGPRCVGMKVKGSRWCVALLCRVGLTALCFVVGPASPFVAQVMSGLRVSTFRFGFKVEDIICVMVLSAVFEEPLLG